ncbi:hypothetical protein GF377_08330, partial [candidate division GN15 bacterium]|nr:hypothetical protein [candidate division GN15 bacterium]
MGRNYLTAAVSALILMLILAAAPVSAEALLTIDRIHPGDLEMIGFELTKGGEVTIEAVGARSRYSDNLVIYAWIIDHETRQPVWEMRGSRTDGYSGSEVLRYAEKVEFMEAGKYELYMFAGTHFNLDMNFSGAKD